MEEIRKAMERVKKSHFMAMKELGVVDDSYTREALEKVECAIDRLERLECYLNKWNNQLKYDTKGVEKKSTIANDIQYLINTRKTEIRSTKKKEKKR